MYIYIHICLYVYIYIYIYIIWNFDSPTGVCEKNTFCASPCPAVPHRKTAIQPLIWCSESLHSNVGKN